jgi:hypothetical protein
MPKYVASRTLAEPLQWNATVIQGDVAGEEPRIFERMGVNAMKLLETKTFSSGVVALHYEPRQLDRGHEG